MNPVEQRAQFDCLTACLASLFECRYEDAPLLCDQDTGEPVDQWLRTMTLWMRERGMTPWYFGLWGDGRPYLKFGGEEIRYHFEPPGYWIAGVKSPRYDGDHAVVMHRQELVWDPHPQREMGHLGFLDAEVPVAWSPQVTVVQMDLPPPDEDGPRFYAEARVTPSPLVGLVEGSDLIDEAVMQHEPVAVYGMFSGGHDSLTATAIAAEHPSFTAAVHINTGIGIEETREFVRETCRSQDWPLIELHPDAKTYEDLVLERGFPGGPKAHNTTYYWLKQRQIRRLVRETKRGRRDRVVLVTGIRSEESTRRMASVMAAPIHVEGAKVWVNPILDWSSLHCQRFMEGRGLARNRVVDLLHRSGECLCGALAHSSEIREIETWFPTVAARIHELERRVEEAGQPECVWAGRLTVSRDQRRLFPVHPLCSSCEAA